LTFDDEFGDFSGWLRLESHKQNSWSTPDSPEEQRDTPLDVLHDKSPKGLDFDPWACKRKRPRYLIEVLSHETRLAACDGVRGSVQRSMVWFKIEITSIQKSETQLSGTTSPHTISVGSKAILNWELGTATAVSDHLS